MKSYHFLFTTLVAFLVSSCYSLFPSASLEPDYTQIYEGSYSGLFKRTDYGFIDISQTKPNHDISIKVIRSGENLVTIQVDETLNGSLHQTVLNNCRLKENNTGDIKVAIYSDKEVQLGGFMKEGYLLITMDINNVSTLLYAKKDFWYFS